MKKREAAILTFLLGCILVGYPTAQLAGSIRGTVIDEKGRPVPMAEVRVDPLTGSPRSEIVRVVETDNDGRFLIGDLELMTYKVFAMKETSGYPNTAFGFYSNHVFPTVSLSNAAPAAEMVLKVGPPAGVVTGTVRDIISGNSVNAGFLLRRASDADNWISMSQKPEFRILLPPDVDVLLEVSAPGYRTWHYGGEMDALKRAPIRLESGAEMPLNIQLEPEQRTEKQKR